jgi:hypothetical protein
MYITPDGIRWFTPQSNSLEDPFANQSNRGWSDLPSGSELQAVARLRRTKKYPNPRASPESSTFDGSGVGEPIES